MSLPKKSQNTWVIVALIATVLFAGGLYAYTHRVKATGDESESWSTTSTVDQQSAEPYTIVPAGDAAMAPSFTVFDLNKKPVKLSDITGRGVIILDFWAIFCKPCQLELVELDSIGKKYATQGVKIYGINSTDQIPKIKRFFGKEQPDVTILSDQNIEAAQKYDVQTLPRVIVIDKKGRIRAVCEGFDENSQVDLSNCLDILLKEN